MSYLIIIKYEVAIVLNDVSNIPRNNYNTKSIWKGNMDKDIDMTMNINNLYTLQCGLQEKGLVIRQIILLIKILHFAIICEEWWDLHKRI